MIRKVELYKSVRDYLTNDLHFEGISKWVDDEHRGLQDKYFYRRSFWIATICPFCGQKQYICWDWNSNLPRYFSGIPSYHPKCISEHAAELDEAQGLYIKKIFHDVDDYLRNHFNCVSCGKDLSLRPGYFFSSSMDLCFIRYGDYSYFVKNGFIPFGFKHRKIDQALHSDCYEADTLYFDCYEDGLLFRKSAEISKGYECQGVEDTSGTRNDDSVYDDNLISRSYLNGIKDKESNIGLYTEIDWADDKLYKRRKISIEQVFELMEYYQNYDDMYEEDVTNLIRTETESIDNSVDVEPVRKELTLDQINEVLKEMIGFETLIISLHSRLKRLYLVKERENSKYLNISTQKEEDDIKTLEKSIKEFTAERERLSSAALDTEEFVRRISESKPKLNYPTEPNKPVEPQYEKPGLFNKKKVEADNAAKKQQYDADMASYNAALSEYNRLVIEVQKMEKEQNEEIRQEAMLLAQENRKKELDSIDSQIKESETKIETAKFEISRKEKEIQAAKDGLSELPWNKEFDQAVELLKKTLEAKIVYEKSEVIFPKYHDLVAYTQFYEYFQAGRCTSLTGPDGAYNLYEAELRQNIIIGKLDDISNSLEEIKQNQYMIYSELKSINSNISKLDDSMNKILDKVTEIGTNVEAIRSNTEIIEENTRIAAYYSKKNAELTNAMGYLVALK